MATLAQPTQRGRSDERFFLITAVAMAVVVFAGFSLQAAAGRSSFSAPLLVHVHAVVFMGWVGLYVLQTAFAATGTMALHRTLGWIGAGWVVVMIVMGCWVTLAMVQRGSAPFFFTPVQFLVFNPLSLFTFAGLTAAAIVQRRRTDWHRRLHYCGMAVLLGPAIGRLLPMPFLIPWAWEATLIGVLIFPVIGIVADLLGSGTVHRAWLWGTGTIVASILLTQAITFSPVGTALYRVLTAGTPGAPLAPLGYPPFPPGPPPIS